MTHKLTLVNKDIIIRAVDSLNIKLDILNTTDSTNTYLQQQTQSDQYHICIAEHQQKGKARFNRQWYSPFGENIYLSIKTTLQKSLNELSGLSLSISTVIIKTLLALFPKLTPLIKWPNDIYVLDKKLSGNLIEVKRELDFKSQVIIGIGLNVNMQYTSSIDQPWISLYQITGFNIDRNIIIIELVKNLIAGLQKFEKIGFKGFINKYSDYDYLKKKVLHWKQ